MPLFQHPPSCRLPRSSPHPQSDYTGNSESKQKSLQKATESANEKLQKAKDTLSEYYSMSEKVGSTEKEWRAIADAIAQTKKEIYEANEEQKNFYTNAHIKELEYEYDELADKLDLINSKMEYSSEAEKIKYLQEQNNLLEEQKQKNKEIMSNYKQQQNFYKSTLSEKGFSFDSSNDIVNAESVLDRYKGTDDYDILLDAYEKYMEIQRDTLPDLQKEWQELTNKQLSNEEEIEEINEEMEKLAKEKKELAKSKELDYLDELLEKQERLNIEMDLLNAKMEGSKGVGIQTEYLKEQIALIEKQKIALQDVNNQLIKQQSYLKNDMKNSGFTFDESGNITNLDSLLNSADTKEEYEELKDKAEEYYETQRQILENEVEWKEYDNEIEETRKSIEELKYELENLTKEAKITELTNETTRLSNEFEKLEKIQGLNGQNTLDILNKQITLIEEQKVATKELLEFRQNQAKSLQKELGSFGFKFDENGLVDNADEVMRDLKQTLSEEEFDKVNESLEEYFDISLNEVNDLENELIDFEKTYEDIMEQKKEATKKIEDEITKIYEKRIEERIKKIEEEKNTQVEALNKQKEAYNNWRKEVEYEDSYNEQLSKVQELQAQIEIARRDDSLSGKKRLEDLMTQLNEEQKTLENLVQDKIDEDINAMLDKQVEEVETNAEEQITNLEETFTEAKIAEMVTNAIQTGMFEELDGNVVSLEETMMNFANNSVEYMGIMGESLKTELLDNLNIALDTMAQISEINKQLNSSEYKTISSGLISSMKLADVSADSTKVASFNTPITFGDTTITVTGNVSQDSIDNLKDVLEKQKKDIIHEIMINVK